MKILFPAFTLLFAPMMAQSEKLTITLADHFPDMELKGEYRIKTSRDAALAAEKEYENAAKQGLATNEGVKFDGIVALPFDISGFSNQGEVLFLFEVRNVHSLKVIAKSWVNPRNGKCVSFDAPWLSKASGQFNAESAE